MTRYTFECARKNRQPLKLVIKTGDQFQNQPKAIRRNQTTNLTPKLRPAHGEVMHGLVVALLDIRTYVQRRKICEWFISIRGIADYRTWQLQIAVADQNFAD